MLFSGLALKQMEVESHHRQRVTNATRPVTQYTVTIDLDLEALKSDSYYIAAYYVLLHRWKLEPSVFPPHYPS